MLHVAAAARKRNFFTRAPPPYVDVINFPWKLLIKISWIFNLSNYVCKLLAAAAAIEKLTRQLGMRMKQIGSDSNTFLFAAAKLTTIYRFSERL